jgi:hypothetical protein
MTLVLFRIVNKLSEEIEFSLIASCHENISKIEQYILKNRKNSAFSLLSNHHCSIVIDTEWCREIEFVRAKGKRYLYSYVDYHAHLPRNSPYKNHQVSAIIITCTSVDDFNVDIRYQCGKYNNCWLSACNFTRKKTS